MTRVEACIESDGVYLSTYYKCTISAITHKLNVPGHMLILKYFLFLYIGAVPKICPRLLVTFCIIGDPKMVSLKIQSSNLFVEGNRNKRNIG
jgi:hypothetical protein